jgi:gluconolactonase
VAGGTRVERIWTGSRSADGIIGAADGSLLITEQAASRITRIDGNGTVTVLAEKTNEGGALAIDAKGRMIVVERLGQNTPNPRGQVTIHTPPTRMVLSTGVDGKPFMALRDLVVDKKGGLYITDGPAAGSTLSSVVYYITPAGRVLKVGEVEGANGVLLSPDEKTLYVTDTRSDELPAFDVRPDGTLANRRIFARVQGAPNVFTDGLAIDAAGRVYVATPLGIQIFTPQGAHLGTIPSNRPTTSVAFAGPQKKTLYFVGRGHDGPDGAGMWARTIYRVSMIADGFHGRPK